MGVFIPLYFLAIIYRCPIWVKVFGGDLDLFWKKSYFYSCLLSLVFFCSQRVFVQTKMLGSFFGRFKSVEVLPNSRSISEIRSKEHATSTSLDVFKYKKVIICVGLVSEEKGAFDLLELARSLPSTWARSRR